MSDFPTYNQTERVQYPDAPPIFDPVSSAIRGINLGLDIKGKIIDIQAAREKLAQDRVLAPLAVEEAQINLERSRVGLEADRALNSADIITLKTEQARAEAESAKAKAEWEVRDYDYKEKQRKWAMGIFDEINGHMPGASDVNGGSADESPTASPAGMLNDLKRRINPANMFEADDALTAYENEFDSSGLKNKSNDLRSYLSMGDNKNDPAMGVLVDRLNQIDPSGARTALDGLTFDVPKADGTTDEKPWTFARLKNALAVGNENAVKFVRDNYPDADNIISKFVTAPSNTRTALAAGLQQREGQWMPKEAASVYDALPPKERASFREYFGSATATVGDKTIPGVLGGNESQDALRAGLRVFSGDRPQQMTDVWTEAVGSSINVASEKAASADAALKADTDQQQRGRVYESIKGDLRKSWGADEATFNSFITDNADLYQKFVSAGSVKEKTVALAMLNGRFASNQYKEFNDKAQNAMNASGQLLVAMRNAGLARSGPIVLRHGNTSVTQSPAERAKDLDAAWSTGALVTVQQLEKSGIVSAAKNVIRLSTDPGTGFTKVKDTLLAIRSPQQLNALAEDVWRSDGSATSVSDAANLEHVAETAQRILDDYKFARDREDFQGQHAIAATVKAGEVVVGAVKGNAPLLLEWMINEFTRGEEGE